MVEVALGRGRAKKALRRPIGKMEKNKGGGRKNKRNVVFHVAQAVSKKELVHFPLHLAISNRIVSPCTP